jgi:hypothetical protein
MKKKLINLLTKTGFSVLLFCLGLLLFNWPLTSVVNTNIELFFTFLFLVWSIIILILFFISKSLDTAASQNNPDTKNTNV